MVCPRSLLSLALVATLLALAAPARAGIVTETDDPLGFDPNIPEWDGNSDPYVDALERTITIDTAPAGSWITGIDVRIDLHHTYVGDLEIRLETATHLTWLWDRETVGDGDGIHRTIRVDSTFNGLTPNQTWYLYIKDRAAGDTGELESWSITIEYTEVSCDDLGYPLGPCGGPDADGQCSPDAWDVRECVEVVESLFCWELREDCWPDGVCTDPVFGPAECIYSGHEDFCAALASVGSGCAHGESDCDSDAQCLVGLDCMGPVGGDLDGCCSPGEAWDGFECGTTDCVDLGYPLGACGSVGTDGDCSADGSAVWECTDVGPANCWVERDACEASDVCWDSALAAAVCIGDAHEDYCAALVDAGSACLWGESDCDSDGECLEGLECKGPVGGALDGCCEPEEEWNGAACVPTDCVELGYPRGGCGVSTTDGRCSGDGGEVWRCVDAGPVNCWDLSETCAGQSVCFDPSLGAAGCIPEGHADYCSALVAVGSGCAHGQSDCDTNGDCADGLDCQGPVWPLPGQDGCCFESERWDGEICAGTCEQECVAGTSGCLNPTRSWTCGEANDDDPCLDRLAEDCGASEVCRDGRCVPATVCTTAADCPADEYCASYGRCAPDVCPTQEAFCRGPAPMLCNEDGSGASVLPACGAGGTCVDGACRCYDDAGCAAGEHCEQVMDAPFFADFTGEAGEPAWTVGEGQIEGGDGSLYCDLVAQAVDQVPEEQGAAAITVPADRDPPLCGQLISARADLGPGQWRARLRAPADPHTISELAADAGPGEEGSAWTGGAIRVQLRYALAHVELAVRMPDGYVLRESVGMTFDEAFHVYGFDWHPDRVVLVVDGAPRASVGPAAGVVIPTQHGRVVLSHWTAPPPHQLAGPPAAATTLVADWVSWSPFGAECEPDVCPAGLLYCDGLERRQCDARGTGSTLQENCATNCSGGACTGACQAAQDCAADEHCAGGRCTADVCPQGTPFCQESELRQCSSDGSGSDLVETCPYGCRDGACLGVDGCQRDTDCEREQYCAPAAVCDDDVCTQGRTFCDGLERRLCNANGSGSTLITICPVACVDAQCSSQCVDDAGCTQEQHCESVSCVPDVCPQGAFFCDGDERRRCNGNGSGSSLIEVCANGACQDGVCEGGPCEPACRGRECGDDGCEGSCGTCDPGYVCEEGLCEEETACTPDCAGRECGDDGCSGSCGTCEGGTSCTDLGTCEGPCEPDCEGRFCGDDGCGDSCGTCPVGTVCALADGHCVLGGDTGGGTPAGDAVGGADVPSGGGTGSGGDSSGCSAAPAAPAGPAPLALLLLALGLALGAGWRRRCVR